MTNPASAALRKLHEALDACSPYLGDERVQGALDAWLTPRHLKEMYRAVEQEREQCAKIAEATSADDDRLQKSCGCLTTGQRIAAVIRTQKDDE